ncbi:hypothetical protein [Arcticibacterium luteifluviistationis]|uniref:Lipoprotein n=1 Tax=Arcticibacterium luteifluviistationis TaxID=1784714 RepID=A0A2Z4GGT8_9BACT|nr:hypothetical protein [Arcticibacterium luteifluviistationis]AWW00235.1 hypothetical protein DJ013_19485 [Arcticibacterium luteifluviistationis]
MKLIAVLGLALALAACNSQSNESASDSESIAEDPTESINTINLSSFQESEFPKAIDGCACYYKEKGKEDEGYIYVDDFSRLAFIKIGDTFEALEIYEAHSENGVVYHKCRAEHYGVDINLTETGHEDETWQYEGSMEINKIDGSKKTIQVIGECGC